jgi:hypothetical protein
MGCFVSDHYPTFAYGFFGALPRWLDVMTVAEATGFVEDLFGPALPAQAVLDVLCDALESDQTHSGVVQVVLKLLKKFLAAKVTVTTLLGLVAKAGATSVIDVEGGRHVLDRFASVPDRVSNALRRLSTRAKIPPAFESEQFFTTLLGDALALYAKCSGSGSGGAAAVIAGKVCRLGHAKLVAKALMPHIISSLSGVVGEVPGLELSLIGALLTSMPTNALESVLHELVLRLAGAESERALKVPLPDLQASASLLWGMLGASCLANRTPDAAQGFVKSMLLHKFMLVRALPLRALALLLFTARGEPSLLNELLASLLSVWAQDAFVRHGAEAQQVYLTEAVVACLVLVAQGDTSEKSFAGHACTNGIIQGVQVRLASPIVPVREQGMRVATFYSRALSLENAIEFDDFTVGPCVLEEDKSEKANAEGCDPRVMYGIGPASVAEKSAGETVDYEIKLGTSKAKAKAKGIEVLGEDDNGLDGGGDGDGDESDDSLEAFDLVDDQEDLRKVKLPTFPQQVLEYFRKPDDRDHVEAGLEALLPIIEHDANGLEEFAVSLLKSLIQIGTTGWVDETKWELMRVRAMVGLLTKVPLVVAPYLCQQVYSEHRTLKDRLDVLEVVAAGARVMAELKPEAAPALNDGTGSKSPFLGIATEQLSASQQQLRRKWEQKEVVRQRVEGKTRRWGQGSGATGPKMGENRFGQVAPLIFYGLMQEDNRAEAQRLFAREPILLSKLLETLAVILICSGTAMSTRKLANSLVQLLWFTRVHDEAAVRRSSLLALMQVFKVLPAHILRDDFADELEELAKWLVDCRGADPDKECRDLALLCLLELREALGDAPFEGWVGKRHNDSINEGGISLQMPNLHIN